MSAESSPPLLRIGDWIVDGSLNRLRHADSGEERPLRHKAMALLLLLAERPGELLSREQIEARIWDGNAYIAPKAINTAVWTIRQALGDDPEAPRYLETIAKKGYRLIAPVQVLARDAAVPPPPAAAPRRLPRLALALLLATALGGLIWLAWRAGRPAAAPSAASPPQALTEYPGIEFAGALSPDRQLLAFAWWQGSGDAELHVRDALQTQAAPRAVGGALGDVTGLAWSADSQSLAYVARAADGSCTVWRVELRDGSRRALAPCEPLFTPSLAWSDDGRWIAYSGRSSAGADPGLFLMRADGREPRRLSRSDNRLLPDHQPAFSPDGSRLAFVRADAGSGERLLFELRLPDGPPQPLARLPLRSLHGLTYAADGQDLILSTTRQDSRQLLRWQRRDGQLRPLGLEGSAPQRTPQGDLVYALLRSHISLARLDLRRPETGLQALERALASRRQPSLRGDRLAFVSRDGHLAQLWLRQGEAPARQRLQLRGEIGRPTWSPDGRELGFVGNCGQGARLALCAISAEGAAPARALLDDGHALGNPVWTAAGLVFARAQGDGGSQLWRWQDGRAAPLSAAPATLPLARVQAWGEALLLLEPDGRALRVWGGGRDERWPLPEDQGRLVAFAAHPQGLLLLLRGSDERLLLWTAASATPRELARFPLGTLPERASMSVADDGSSLVLERADIAQGDLMLAPGAALNP